MSGSSIKICIVDDHQIVVDGIRSLLAGSPHIVISGQTNKPTQVPAILEQNPTDILLTDVNMPEMSGVELTRLVRKQFPAIKVICLSMFGDQQAIAEMLSAGASGYVLKNTGMEELLEAIERVAAGKTFYSEEVMHQLVKSSTPESRENRLTNREIEIIRLIERELSNKQISDKLFLSERTVETHRKNIFRKTETQSVVGLLKYAYEHKII